MCISCMVADWTHKWVPDAKPDGFISLPYRWVTPQLDEFTDILQRIKDLEGKVGGCPCEDISKMDFLRVIKERLDQIDEKLKSSNSV